MDRMPMPIQCKLILAGMCGIRAAKRLLYLTNRHFPPALRAEPENMAKLYHSAALYGIIYMKEGVHRE